MAKNSKEVQKKADEKRVDSRAYNWLVIFYPEDLPTNWLEMVDERLQAKFLLSPLHDRDVNGDGTPKKPHYHAVFMFSSKKSLKQLKEWFSELFGTNKSGNVIGVPQPKIAGDRGGAIRYLAHLDNPEKALYEVSEIRGFGGADPVELLKYSASETHEKMIAMERYIEDHKITEIAEFSKAIRDENPDWYMILTTRSTVYFNAFIRSRRHMAENNKEVKKVYVEKETGEIFDDLPKGYLETENN